MHDRTEGIQAKVHRLENEFGDIMLVSVLLFGLSARFVLFLLPWKIMKIRMLNLSV